MAGGPNAEVVMCIRCTGRAVRIAEGLEDDRYRCEDCATLFAIDWSDGPPSTPRWPPSAEELAEARRYLQLDRPNG